MIRNVRKKNPKGKERKTTTREEEKENDPLIIENERITGFIEKKERNTAMKPRRNPLR